jgi:AraC-like DNA-binding protein
MASRLSQVSNWEERARHARFSVSILSNHCGVSRRLLLNFVKGSFGTTPHQWMLKMRMREAGALLRQGNSVKEVSYLLRYKQVAHFCREFKRYHGVPPGHFSLMDVGNSSSSHSDKKFPSG